MKKIFYFNFIFLIGLFLMTSQVFACSPVAGAVYPTAQSVLKNSDTAIGVYKITNDGSSVPGVLVVGNENSSMNIIFKIDKTSCSTRLDNFRKGEYIVAIFNKNDDVVSTTDLDAQFIYSFSSTDDAMVKYSSLFEKWNEREKVLGKVSENGDIQYVVAGKTLKAGMRDDDDVRSLQLALKVKLGLGEGFKIDGSYGPATIAVVKRFQKEQGLKDDGIAGVKTQAKLSGVVLGKEEKKEEEQSTAYVASEKILRVGMRDDDDVRSLQLALKVKLGLGEGFKIDGSYGPATIAVVKRFQKEQGLKDDGIAGVKTQAKLIGTLIPLISQKKPTDISGDQDTETIDEGNDGSTTIENADSQVVETSKNNSANDDIINTELRSLLSRAKGEIIHYAVGEKDYTSAYELVAGYNNTFLSTYADSDPLYKSFGGGSRFIYSIKLKGGEYLCADNNYQKEITQKPERPNMDDDQASC